MNHDLLLKHATPAQAKILAAVKKHGTNRKAATALGIASSTVDRAMRRLQKRVAKIEPSTHAKEAPTGYHLRGASTLLDAGGNVVQQWVKTAKSEEDPAVFMALFNEALESAPPRARTMIPPGSSHDEDLLAIYPMGDPHIGMLSWGAETGQAFDLKIAERNLTTAVDKLVGLAPATETALIINLGDFFHSDNMQNRTTRSGHVLDVDSRWGKVLQVGVRIKLACIDRALEKHKRVVCVVVPGNHDDHSAIMLAVILTHHYRNEPRFSLLNEVPPAYQYFEFGTNLIGTAHGHNCKKERLPGIMANDMYEAWGRTKHRHIYLGHVHHSSLDEYPGVLVETCRTLAARDAWTHNAGFRSGRSMFCDVKHIRFGQRLRHEVGIEEIEQAA